MPFSYYTVVRKFADVLQYICHLKIAYLSGSFAAGGSTTFLEINTVKEVFDRSYQFHLPE